MREREIAAMTAIAQSTAVSLKRMKDQNEALQFSMAALDAHTRELEEQVKTQTAALEVEQKRNEEMWAAYNSQQAAGGGAASQEGYASYRR